MRLGLAGFLGYPYTYDPIARVRYTPRLGRPRPRALGWPGQLRYRYELGCASGRLDPASGLLGGRLARLSRSPAQRSIVGIRWYNMPSHISCYHVAERCPPWQNSTGPTSAWCGPALVSRALRLEAVCRLVRPRRERPVQPIGRQRGGGRGRPNACRSASGRTSPKQQATALAGR